MALIVGILVLLAIGLIFWPEKGLISLWVKSRQNLKRILIEDALKFIFYCEYKDYSCELHSIAGNLDLSSGKVTKIIDQL
jgi:DtxR family Mn-dependent transcriptional regulator